MHAYKKQSKGVHLHEIKQGGRLIWERLKKGKRNNVIILTLKNL